MKYVKLTYEVLLSLRERGYNILRSKSPLSSENPSWYPDTVDLMEFLDIYSEELDEISMPGQELHLLIIQDALDNINEKDLIGEVWV